MLELREHMGNQGGGESPRRPERDVFSRLLGEGWEAQGDGTYRFVGIDRSSADALGPERPTRELQTAKRSDETDRVVSSVENRKRGLWRKR